VDVPDDYRGNENHVNSIKAHGMGKLRFSLEYRGAGSSSLPRSLISEEEEFDVSLLHDWNEDSLFLVKSGTNKSSSADLTVCANVQAIPLARTYS